MPLSKFHAKHWPLILRHVGDKVQIMDILRWEPVTDPTEVVEDLRKVLWVLQSSRVIIALTKSGQLKAIIY